MGGEDGETAQTYAAVQRAASGEGVEEAKETTSTATNECTAAINALRDALHAFVCRRHWSEAAKQLAFRFVTKCALVRYGTLSLREMDCSFQHSYVKLMMDYLGLKKPFGNALVAAPRLGEEQGGSEARGFNLPRVVEIPRQLDTDEIRPRSSVERPLPLKARGLNIQWPFSQLILGGALRRSKFDDIL